MPSLPFDLEELKLHCHIDHDEDDILLATYTLAAIQEGELKTNRSWSDWTAETFPESLKIWIFLRVAGFYDQRTDVAVSRRGVISPMPRNFADSLLDRWVKI
jgi:uncharacterized phage protein (predicted DNA packaging)